MFRPQEDVQSPEANYAKIPVDTVLGELDSQLSDLTDKLNSTDKKKHSKLLEEFKTLTNKRAE